MKYLRILLFVIPFFLSVIGTVQAALVERDFVTGSGDRLITLDTNTQLEWLDITEMMGRSYDEISFDAYVTDHGFRLATGPEFFQLVADFNISSHTGYDAENVPGAQNFINMLGFTDMSSPHPSGTYMQKAQGFFQKYDGHYNATLGIVALYFKDDTFTAKAYQFMNYSSEGYPSVGAYLVRNSAVPIPGAVWLLGSGIIGLAGIHRKTFNQ